ILAPRLRGIDVTPYPFGPLWSRSVGLRSRRLQVRLLSGIISLQLSSQGTKRLEKPTTEWKPAAEYPLVSKRRLGNKRGRAAVPGSPAGAMALTHQANYEPAAPMADPTFPNVALALVPRAVMAIRQTTIIRASMTAYSTAVGTSSFFKNSTTCL